MVWVSLCSVYLAVSLALNDRSPTGRFAFVSSFLDHRHLVTGVTSCIDHDDDLVKNLLLSLSLSFARKVKRKRGIRGKGELFQRAKDCSLRIEFEERNLLLDYWWNRKFQKLVFIHFGFWIDMNFYSIERHCTGRNWRIEIEILFFSSLVHAKSS